MTTTQIGLALLALALVAIGFLGPVYRPRCPECHKPADRIIHAGVPMWFCISENHCDGVPLGLGWLSLLLGTLLPWDGWLFMVDGPYLPGLWRWWRHLSCDHERGAGDVRVLGALPVLLCLALGIVAWRFGLHWLAWVFFALAALLAVVLAIAIGCLYFASDSAGRRKDSP